MQTEGFCCTWNPTQRLPDYILQNGVPGWDHYKMTCTSKCNERMCKMWCGYFWIYMDLWFLWVSMGFYCPKHSIDFLASGNRASTGECAPSFCSSLSCATLSTPFCSGLKNCAKRILSDKMYLIFYTWNPRNQKSNTPNPSKSISPSHSNTNHHKNLQHRHTAHSPLSIFSRAKTHYKMGSQKFTTKCQKKQLLWHRGTWKRANTCYYKMGQKNNMHLKTCTWKDFCGVVSVSL